ncbi:hypothetical protein DIPPA_01141, partial [Diplonema papillatum]
MPVTAIPGGESEAVRNYALQHAVLKLVDDMVAYLLEDRPMNPARSLVSYFSKLAGVGELEVNDRAASISVTMSDKPLVEELRNLWEVCGCDVNEFNIKLKKALPDKAQAAWKQLGSSLRPAKPPAQIDVSENSSGAGDVTLISTDQPTKFEATDDINRGSADIVTRVSFYNEGYQPAIDVLEVVSSLNEWHAIGRQLWPASAIRRLSNTCKLMTERHNYGEPIDIVIPLYLYSVSLYRSIVWSVWVQTAIADETCGRWVSINDAFVAKLERALRTHMRSQTFEVGDEMTWDLSLLLEPIVNAEARNDNRRLAESDDIGGRRFSTKWSPKRLKVALKGGVAAPCLEGAAEEEKPPVEGWKELIIFEESDVPRSLGESDVFVARYELDESDLRNHPMQDAIAWLPLPHFLAGSAKKRVPSNIFYGRNNAFCCLRDDTNDDDNANAASYVSHFSTMQLDGSDRSLSLTDLPPAGVLEYLRARRAAEALSWSHSGTQGLSVGAALDASLHSEYVFAEATEVQDLVAACFQQHNQQEYVEALRQRLVDLREKGSLLGLEDIIEYKLGCSGFNGNPTPLVIAHALDLQRVFWRGRYFIASLSGISFCICEERLTANGHKYASELCPFFRVEQPFEDQPYWHLNATMRNLQNDTTPATVHYSKSDLNHEVGIDVEESFVHTRQGTFATSMLPNMNEKIVFHARPAALLGRGLDLLESVTNKPALKHVLRRLRKYSWLTTLDSSTNWTVSHNADLRSDVDTPDDYLDIFPTELYSTECVGWWGRHKGGDPAYFLKQENVKVHLGTWMLDQVRPLLFYVNRAMQDMSREIKSKNWRCAPEGLEKGYRGLRNVKLDRKVYDRGNAVLWASFSSTSKDQGISQSYADGKDSSVFIIKGSSCRLIAPWSRFGREEEWLYPLNSMFQVRSLLTEEQKRVLGKQNFQLFEIEEVDDDGLQVIQIRKSLAQAMTKEAAGIIFAACNAIREGSGVLDLRLDHENDGEVPSKWYWTVTVNYDPHDQCPVNTTNVRSECPTHLARALQSESERLVDEGKTVLVDFSSGRDTLNVIADILRIPTPKGPDFAEIEWHRQRIRGRAAATDCFKISAKKPTERWELVLEVREDTGHDGFAIKDEGAEILHSILKRNVRLQRIDVRNNKITSKGAALLLSSLRVNHNIHQLAIADRSGSLLDSHLHHGEKKWERLLERLQLQLCVFAALVVRFAYENKFKLPFLNLLRLRRLDSVPSKLSDGCDTPITRVNSEFSATERTYEQHSDKGEETRDAKVLMEIQSVINLRCQHHKGTVDLDGVRDFGRHWPQYAASAFWDVAQLDVNMSDLFDEQPHEIASFFALLAENCILNTGQKAFPKLPGALVSAARVGDLKLVDLLLFMCCNKEETDDFGETPFLKLKRRSQDRHRNLNQIELCKLEKHLRVPLQYVTSARKIKQNDVEWQLKNFALEVVRICEAKEDAGTVGLLDEIQKNISQHTKAPRAPGDILDLLRQRAKRCISQARSCSHLSRTPIGRMNTTLLCYYLYCSASQDIEKSLIPGEETRKDYLRSTGRRKNPISEEDWPNWKDHAREKKYRPYLTRHLFGQSVELLWKANEEKEEKKERRRTAHGLYLFEHEFHGYLNTTRPMELKADPQLPSKEWALCEPKDEAPAIMQETGRKYVNVMGDVRKMTLVGYKKALWNVAQREPLGVRKKNASGVYVFKHDWFPDEDGDWDTQPAQEDCGESSVTLSDCLTRHTRTLYDPHIGGRCALVSAREGISKWAHLWASLCAVLSSTDEVDRAIFRSVQNVPEATFFAHMNLEKGALYGFPEISLWNVERRSYENRYLSKEELSSAENGAKQWKACKRKWTKPGRTGELRYRNEWKSDLRWDEADEETPFYTDTDQVMNQRRPSMPQNGTGNTLHFIATGKMRGAHVTEVCDKAHDVLLAALETFVVEDVIMEGNVLNIKLIARGSVLLYDKELSRWASRVRLHLSRNEETQLEDAEYANRWPMQPNRPPVTTNKTPTDATSLKRTTNADRKTFIYFSSSTQALPPEGRRAYVDKILVKVLKPVNTFAFNRNKAASSSMSYSHAVTEVSKNVLPLPVTLRPSYTFLRQLGRAKDSTQYLGHIPFIQLDENLILKDSTTTIEISAKTIRDQHEKDNADFSKDPLFRDLNRSSPSPEDVFGTEVFSITVGEVQQLVKTTKVTTSASFPIEFFRALVEIVTRVDFVLFFNIFRATPLSKLAFEWDECKKAARNLNTASLTRAEANRKAFTEPQRKYQQNVLYECRTLENKLLTDREQLESIHSQVLGWVEHVQHNSVQFGFSSWRHAQFNLNKSLIELSTEICVSQHGYLFTSGTNGNHNHIAPRTDRTVVFLSSPGIDFCFPQPTLQEAPKYFERVASKAENPESGWKYFKFGKEEELEHRVRVLYTSIFKAAQQQGVRNMCMLPLGLGVFLTNLDIELLGKVIPLYYKAQFALLCEQDWGFEN